MGVKENTRKQKNRNLLQLPIAAAFCFCLLPLLTSCQPNQAILDSQNKSQTPNAATNSNAPTLSSFEYDIQSMKNANFDFIYVFRRNDGGKITVEDGKFAKANSPFETNRFVISDEERAIIAGSNTKVAAVNLEALKSGFAVTDLSKPEAESNTNTNINANK